MTGTFVILRKGTTSARRVPVRAAGSPFAKPFRQKVLMLITREAERYICYPSGPQTGTSQHIKVYLSHARDDPFGPFHLLVTF